MTRSESSNEIWLKILGPPLNDPDRYTYAHIDDGSRVVAIVTNQHGDDSGWIVRELDGTLGTYGYRWNGDLVDYCRIVKLALDAPPMLAALCQDAGTRNGAGDVAAPAPTGQPRTGLWPDSMVTHENAHEQVISAHVPPRPATTPKEAPRAHDNGW